MSLVLPPADENHNVAGALSTALARLASADAEAAALSGGVGAANLLAEFAHTAAGELARHFDALPNPAFDGVVPKADGRWRWLRGSRRIPHRLLAVRYTQVEPDVLGDDAAYGLLSYDAMGYLLAIGADGQLRTALVYETIRIATNATIPDAALPFTDERTRNVPSSRATLHRWTGANDPAQVAPPEVVLDLLHRSATMLHDQLRMQGTLLQRLLGTDALRSPSP